MGSSSAGMIKKLIGKNLTSVKDNNVGFCEKKKINQLCILGLAFCRTDR